MVCPDLCIYAFVDRREPVTRRVAGAGRLPETLSRAGRSADHCGYVALAVERSRFMDVTYTIYSMAVDGRWTMADGRWPLVSPTWSERGERAMDWIPPEKYSVHFPTPALVNNRHVVVHSSRPYPHSSPGTTGIANAR